MAGTKRISYPSNVKIIRVPCTGKVDAIHLMKALEKGADGVYIAACLEGDCHFKNGNLHAMAHVEKIKKSLEDLGWEPERVGHDELFRSYGSTICPGGRRIHRKD